MRKPLLTITPRQWLGAGLLAPAFVIPLALILGSAPSLNEIPGMLIPSLKFLIPYYPVAVLFFTSQSNHSYPEIKENLWIVPTANTFAYGITAGIFLGKSEPSLFASIVAMIFAGAAGFAFHGLYLQLTYISRRIGWILIRNKNGSANA